MSIAVHIKARISPWDDPEFVKAFETARDAIEDLSDRADTPRAAHDVQERLRAAGYPNARVEVIRTVEEALAHTSHWDVRRDG